MTLLDFFYLNERVRRWQSAHLAVNLFDRTVLPKMPRLAPKQSPRAELAAALCPIFIEVARADGEVVQDEVRIVREFFATRLMFSDADLKPVRLALKAALAAPKADLPELVRNVRNHIAPKDRLLSVNALYEMALVDGELKRRLELPATGWTRRYRVRAFGQADPWRTQHYFGGNGDGTLYYPGKPSKIGGTKHVPIESIRLKLLREGMEDYEYLHLLKTMGEEAYANEQLALVVTNTYTWNRDPLDFYDAREKMAARIARTTPDAGPFSDNDNVGPNATTAIKDDSSGGGGGGGGCGLNRTAGPTDFRQAIPFLLIFSSPFWGSLWRRIGKKRA